MFLQLMPSPTKVVLQTRLHLNLLPIQLSLIISYQFKMRSRKSWCNHRNISNHIEVSKDKFFKSHLTLKIFFSQLLLVLTALDLKKNF